MKSAKPGSAHGVRSGLEALESRRLLSAAPTAHPHAKLVSPPAGGSIDGFTPSQIRHAYGFDAAPGDGTGQTIAIVDAFKDPNIVADLNTFDQQFGLAAPPGFSIVNQYGGSVRSVQTDAGWASEIAMDVEWAHAIAPKANLVLIETNSDNYPDLMAGVNSARHMPGVSVVSMSWGSGEFSSQLQYDSYFTSPANHPGVTFVAATGDDGSSHGPEWPATSPNVLSVGGSTLDTSGAVETETGWRDTSGGISRYEKRPLYQTGVQGNRHRAVPDVAYNANPDTGYAVYSSVKDSGYVGWQVEAGTSAGAPQWAAQIAIADQLRANLGQGSLDGGSATLPALYQLYHAPGTAGYSTYTADFNDITQGRSARRSVAAEPGYDCQTGLGTPKAAGIISALLHATVSTASTTAVVPAVVKASARHAREFIETNREGETSPSAIPAPPAGNFTKASVAAQAHGDSGIPTILQSDAGSIVISPSAAPIKAGVAPERSRSSFISLPEMDISSFVANDIAPPSVFSGVLNVVGTIDASTPVANAAVPMLLDFGRTEALASFADALAGFAHESAALGDAINTATGTHARAWAVTFAVLGVDAILIGYWRASRYSSKSRSRRAGLKRTPFSMLPM